MFSTAVQILVKVEHVTIPWWSGDPSNNEGTRGVLCRNET